MANGLSISTPPCEQIVSADVLVGQRLQAGDGIDRRRLAEQVGKALLRPQVFLDRQQAADLGRRLEFAVLGFEHREDAGFLGQPRERWCRARPCPSRAGRDEDVDVARAAEGHRLLDLVFEVAQVGDRAVAT
jgi:hypothetical protein